MRRLTLALLSLCLCVAAAASSLNGFDLSDTLVPRAEIVLGGPPKDGIPALTLPKFHAIDDVEQVEEDLNGWVLAVSHGKAKKAYPISILNFHELVNDELDGQPILVSWCPLCGTGMVFSRTLGDRTLTFGVSGLLYNNNLLMYDHQTQSLWSQARGQAVAGPLKGAQLSWRSVEHLPLSDWRLRNKNGLLLSRDTGHRRNYDFDPYPGYSQSDKLFFPLSHSDKRYPRKEWVLAVRVNGVAKAYPYQELEQMNGPVKDSVGGVQLLIHYDSHGRYARLESPGGVKIPVIYSYWFSWVANFPNTEVYRAN